MTRLAGGRIDTAAPFTITVDGQDLEAFAGDTVASALVAAGRLRVGDSIYLGRPRGIVSAGVDEPNALITVEAPLGGPHESMLPATTVEAYPGLRATTLSGLGTLDPTPDVGFSDTMHAHTDVLVIGGGPAGLAAASRAVEAGARVTVIDDQPELGGALLSSRDGADAAWLQARVAEVDASADCTVLTRTSALGSYDSNYIVAVERRTAHLGADAPPHEPRERLWHIRAREVVLATGALQRPLVFAGNDRPGVMQASAVRTYLNRFAACPGSRVAIMTVDDSAYELAHDLASAGVDVAAIVDSRPAGPHDPAAAPPGVEVLTGSAVTATAGDPLLASVEVRALDDAGVPTGEPRTITCDVLAVAGGWNPNVALHSQRQGRLNWDDDAAAFLPETPVTHQHLAGAVTGLTSTESAAASGARAGALAAEGAGFAAEGAGFAAEPSRDAGPVRPLWLIPSASGTPDEWRDHIVDAQRDQTVADVWRATGAGLHNVEHVKRYTSISTGADQGKSSAVAAIGVIAQALGGTGSPGAVGTTTFRAPYVPVAFSTLAGPARGDLYDPVRTTPIHAWHVEAGAEFEIVGQWMRPFYYPRPGEDADAAVRRECAAVRTSVGMMDASTLGKIEVRGADAGEFLNRIYTNGFKKLAVGKARYGVMCGVDGMVIDDGVTMRLGDDHYFLTTTTGGAAHIYTWLEEWLQTEWPELDVTLTSVTEQWTTLAVAGPTSRAVVAALCPDLDVSAEALGFMELAPTTLSNGLEARVARISFSGELAFEISVPGWYGLALWEAVYEAGRPHDITPYGTEAMHVLRAEKGYPIVGQDTDGTVTPHDLGMAWVVSKLKDFVGKRSFSRDDTARTDRKQLVGLLPADGTSRLAEGSQLVATGVDLSTTPVPMDGHVTSAYFSTALDSPFALGLLRDGQQRVGHQVQVVCRGESVACDVVSPVLYDPEGSRRDG